MSGTRANSRPDFAPYWMPFTANRAFKKDPRLIVSAEGFHYQTDDGRTLLDSFSGLWTTGLGHCHPRIVEAVREQVGRLDYTASFQVSHPAVFELADRLVRMAPDGLDHCFFVNSGSESVDTALKIALAWQRQRGEGTRTRFIGRERGYHGVNFGGTSVGGIPGNRAMFSGSLLPNVSHLPHTHDLEHNGFSRGQPAWGAHLADDLERLVSFHGAATIAAVIVEPVAGSTGILPPPVGYLERLRDLCTQYGILLIFDEVITAFGRVGAAFGAERFDVTPDIITTAKGLTNGVIPMGAVLVSSEIHDAFMTGPEHAIELAHGYTYSGHPVATAAALAALDIYEQEGVFEQARANEQRFEDALHSFGNSPNVVDIRNFGLMGVVELAPREGAPGERGLDVHVACFNNGLMVRNGGDTIQFSPFLTATPDYFDQVFDLFGKSLKTVN